MMRRFSSTSRHFLTVEDAIDLYEAPRPCTLDQIESHMSAFSVPPPPYTHAPTIPSAVRRLSPGTGSSVFSHEVPHLTKTPWEWERNKRNSIWRRTRVDYGDYVFPAGIFKTLPREVYDCIIRQLELLHFWNDQSCPSCYLRDLHSLSLTSRAWDRAATLQMYCKVWVLCNDEHSKLPKIKFRGTGRLKLLRRTLRERQALARFVKELHLPDFQHLYQNASIEREEIVNLVASVVMACPKLERLVGFHIPFTHTFDRLSHALSTRKSLKERLWFLAENNVDSEDEDDDLHGNYYSRANDPTECFLDLNAHHPSLTTLVIHQQPDQPTPLTFRAIIGTFRQFPVLQHLSISNLPPTTFSNLALNALPQYLRSLRLENLSGINDKGLERFARSNVPTSLESLMLIDLEVSNLSTVAQFLTLRMDRLKRFTFSQSKTPHLPIHAPIPRLESKTVQYIHWEIQSQAGPSPTLLSPFSAQDSEETQFPFPNSEPFSCLATCLLSTSIKDGLFPELKKIRAPHDPQGVLQALCRPRATALLPTDNAFFAASPRSASSTPLSSHPSCSEASSSYMSPAYSGTPSFRFSSSLQDSRADSPISGIFAESTDNTTYGSMYTDTTITPALTPARSRLAAQARILDARKHPFIIIKVTDPDGEVRINRTIFGFLGDISSKITYEVKPDRQRVTSAWAEETEENEWITGVHDITGEWHEPEGLRACRHISPDGARGRVVEVMDMF